MLRFPAMPFALPPAWSADADGLVAIGGRLDVATLLAAYRGGLFPWSEDPVRWYSPDPRAIVLPETVHLPRNLPKLRRRAGFTVTADRAFAAVIAGCAEAHAADGTWIGPRLMAAYVALHAAGHAHSIEVWQGAHLVGGLYGVQVGAMFAGESMFHRAANASKVAFAALWAHLQAAGVWLVDAQVVNAHSARLGAVEVPRPLFLALLARATAQPTPPAGRWTLDGDGA